MNAIGVGLIQNCIESFPLPAQHPLVGTYGWHDAHELENEEKFGDVWHRCDRSKEMLELEQLYGNRIQGALYAKKFGEDHPFFKMIQRYLIDGYPYKSTNETFKNLLNEQYKKVTEAWLKKCNSKLPTYEEWKNKILEDHFSLLMQYTLAALHKVSISLKDLE